MTLFHGIEKEFKLPQVLQEELNQRELLLSIKHNEIGDYVHVILYKTIDTPHGPQRSTRASATLIQGSVAGFGDEYVMSTDSWVLYNYRRTGLGTLMQKIKLALLSAVNLSDYPELDRIFLLATVNNNNEAQIKLMQNFSWQKQICGTVTSLWCKEISLQKEPKPKCSF